MKRRSFVQLCCAAVLFPVGFLRRKGSDYHRAIETHRVVLRGKDHPHTADGHPLEPGMTVYQISTNNGGRTWEWKETQVEAIRPNMARYKTHPNGHWAVFGDWSDNRVFYRLDNALLEISRRMGKELVPCVLYAPLNEI